MDNVLRLKSFQLTLKFILDLGEDGSHFLKLWACVLLNSIHIVVYFLQDGSHFCRELSWHRIHQLF